MVQGMKRREPLDAMAELEAALAQAAEVDELEQHRDKPLVVLTPKQRDQLAGKYEGRMLEFVRRYGVATYATLSIRQMARIEGKTEKQVWLRSQVAHVPQDVFDELLDAFLDELPDHRSSTWNISEKIIDVWRSQVGRKPIRSDAPTHKCPNCGHRW